MLTIETVKYFKMKGFFYRFYRFYRKGRKVLRKVRYFFSWDFSTSASPPVEMTYAIYLLRTWRKP